MAVVVSFTPGESAFRAMSTICWMPNATSCALLRCAPIANCRRSARPISSAPSTPTAVTCPVSARTFAATFPQLEGLRFTHRWAGVIDTTSRFTVTFGQTMGGRVTYALGYTGLGVGASRWAAGVVRDFILWLANRAAPV